MMRSKMKSQLANIVKLYSFNDYLFYIFFFSGIFPILNTLLGGFISIRLYAFIVVPIVLTISGLGLWKVINQIKNININIKERKKYYYVIFLAIIFLSILFSHFIVFLNTETPILHDPVSHSIWAQDIINKNKIDFFYSPFIHSTIATISSLGIITVPRMLVLLTSLGYLLLPIVNTFNIKLITKNNKLTIGMFLVMSSIIFPVQFYYTAGKNALTLALLIASLATYFNFKYLYTKNIYNGISVVLSLLVLFLTHYPTAAITAIFLCPFILQDLIHTKEKKQKVFVIIPYVLAAFIAGGWFIFAQKFNSTLAEDSTNSLQNSVPISYTTGYINRTKDTIDFIINQFNANLSLHQPLLIFPFLIILTSKKLKSKYIFSILWLILFGFLTIGIIVFFKLGILVMVMKTMQILIPYVIAIAAVLILFPSSNLVQYNLRNLFFWLFVSIFIIYINIQLTNRITAANDKFQSVTEEDIEAYEFIQSDIPTDEYIINSAIKTEARNIVFPSDGGMWIPAFTGNSILFDFREFSSQDTQNMYQLYENIINNNTDDASTILELEELGYRYIYIDQGVFAEGLKENHLQNVDYEIVFENDIVKILKLN